MSALATVAPPIRASDAAGIAAAAAALRSGALVGLPTETVYGLAADASDPDAVARVFAAKDRPRINPLIVHCAEAGAALALLRRNSMLDALASAFWPGPLTLIGDAAPDAPVCDLARAGLTTLAVRVPAHP
ncbi:MAG: Sua5/YciO/YrdC/YwlC family protein, partial [Pseudomonadota bacterium]